MSRYSSGANFERRVIKSLREQGWFCARSAGSHGAADIIAFLNGEVKLIQCQTNSYFPPSKREQLIELAGANRFQAWLAYKDDKRQIVMKELMSRR